MTIGELIEELSQYDKKCEVKIFDYEYNDISKIENDEFLGNKVVIFYEQGVIFMTKKFIKRMSEDWYIKHEFEYCQQFG